MEELEWPENDAATAERDQFDARLMSLLGEATVVAFVPVPAPLEPTAERVEAASGLERVALPYEGLAWLCPVGTARRALRPVFAARVPELSVMGFRAQPSATEVFAALNATDGRPADRVLFFDDGVLMAVRSPQSPDSTRP